MDHYLALKAGVAGDGTVDYEARSRDPQLEQHTEVAERSLKEVFDWLEGLKELAGDPGLNTVLEQGCLDNESEKPTATSSLSLELHYLISHTVHHYAIIAMILHLQDLPVDADFGVALSTLRYRQKQEAACAQ